MAQNVGLRGRIVDSDGRGIEGLRVTARDKRRVTEDAFLGIAFTDADGHFSVSYSPSAYVDLFTSAPDPYVVVKDTAGIRALAETDPVPSPRDEVVDIGELRIRRTDATGHLTTGLSGQTHWVTHGNRVDHFVDGEATFDAVLRAIEGSRRSIDLMQLLLKPDLRASFGPGEDLRTGGRLFVDALREAVTRGVRVRILLNENLVVPDDVDDVRAAFEGIAGKVLVRRFPMSPATLHAKLVVVDDVEAYVPGQPFEPRFWDTRAHLLDDARRGRGVPMHDVASRVRGPAVRDLAALFVELWNMRGEMAHGGADQATLPPAAPPPEGDVTLQVNVTTPAGILRPEGMTTIFESYERVLANAQQYAYIETQYFTSELMTRAIRRALDANPTLEVILVLNEQMDFPTYNVSQARRLDELGWPDEPRLGVFTLWSWGQRAGTYGVRPIYVHSKTSIVDDAWCTAGSANLDGISLEGARELGFPDDRQIDQNLLLLDGIEGAPKCGNARRLRSELWAEHIGGTREEYAVDPPSTGWLRVWRAAAEENARRLTHGERPTRGSTLGYRSLPEGIPVFDRSMNVFNQR